MPIFAVAALVCLQSQFYARADLPIDRMIWGGFIAVDIYSILLLWQRSVVHPFMLLPVFAVFLAMMVRRGWQQT